METKGKRTRNVSIILALVGLLLVWTLATAGDLEPSGPPGPTMKTLDEVEPRIPIRASDLPLVITEPNSYYFVEDINFAPTSSFAIRVYSNDVTIDLMGYTLKGPDSGSGVGIYMNGRGSVEIRNGTIRDFGTDAIREDNNSGNSHRAINIHALSNGSKGIRFSGYGHMIKDCIASKNGNEGLVPGSGSTVTGNTCYDNGNHGIDAGNGSTVTGNSCYDNVGDGINASNGNTITGNTCYVNGGSGIYVSSGCTIIGNTARSNTGYGINAGTYCLVDQNTTYSNTAGNMVTGTGCVLGVNCAP